MSANRVVFAFLGLLVLKTGGLSPAAASPQGRKKPVEVPFTVLMEGQFSWIDYPLQAVVRDQNAWEALWSLHADRPMWGVTTPPPIVHFEHEMVVAVFLGMRSNTAFRVHLDNVLPAEDGSYLVAYVEEEIRAKGLVFDDIVTTPFVFAVLPRTEGTVTFAGTKVVVKRRK